MFLSKFGGGKVLTGTVIICNNVASRISIKDYERDRVGQFGNCQRAAGRCKAVVQTQPEFRSGVVGPTLLASRPNRVRPLQRRSIQLILLNSASIEGGRVLDEAVAATLQQSKVVTRKLPSIFWNSRASRPYV